jgi:hypothetical protein
VPLARFLPQLLPFPNRAATHLLFEATNEVALDIAENIEELDAESEREGEMSEQLEGLYEFAEKSRFRGHPLDAEFTFAYAKNLNSSELPTDQYPLKLFLGADEDYEMWAYPIFASIQ